MIFEEKNAIYDKTELNSKLETINSNGLSFFLWFFLNFIVSQTTWAIIIVDWISLSWFYSYRNSKFKGKDWNKNKSG